MTALAADISELPVQLGEIFYYIVLPILLLAGVGFLLQRRLGLDMPTLTRLNFYYVMPGMVYSAIVTSRVTPDEVQRVVVFSLSMIVCLGLVTLVVALVRRVPRNHWNALLMTVMFYNSGNYGLPLQKFAFRAEGRGNDAFGLQVFVMLTQNIVNFTVGIWLAATGQNKVPWKKSLLHIVKFPPIYALTAGLLTIQIRRWLGDAAPDLARGLTPFWDAIEYLRSAFIAVALCTLGAKLALVRRESHSYPVKLSVVLRLLIAPCIGLALTYLLGLTGFAAQVVLISTCTPTAINVMLLCLEFDNHPDYAARAVFYSTLISPITVTLVIFLAKGRFLSHLVMN